MGTYEHFREEMLLAGWKPITQTNPVEDYTELQCGNRICIASWFDGEVVVEFTVWFGDPGGSFVLAPETE